MTHVSATDLSIAMAIAGAALATYSLRLGGLLLADAATGKVIKRLHSPQRDQHIDAISFIQDSDAALSKQITRLQERIDLQIAALEAQFAAADTLLAGLESQQDLLTKLFAANNDNN